MGRAVSFGLVLLAGGGLALAGLVQFGRATPDTESRFSEQAIQSHFDNVTDEQFCEMMKKDAEKINREAPITVDSKTRLDGMVVVCALHTVTYKKSVFLRPNELQEGWRKFYQRGHDQTTCENGLYSTMTRRGWRMAQRVDFASGEYAVFETVACPPA